MLERFVTIGFLSNIDVSVDLYTAKVDKKREIIASIYLFICIIVSFFFAYKYIQHI